MNKPILLIINEKVEEKDEEDYIFFLKNIILWKSKKSVLLNELKKNAFIIPLEIKNNLNPLPLVYNFIIDSKLQFNQNFIIKENEFNYYNLYDLLTYLNEQIFIENIFILLNKSLFNDFKKLIYFNFFNIKYLYINYFNKIESNYLNFGKLKNNIILKISNIFTYKNLNIKSELWKFNYEENQYIKLLKYILSNGENRLNQSTLSIFGYSMRFNLSNSFPLLTTKKMFWRAIVEELLWFISGSTNSKVLEEKGIFIWKKNSSREYLNKLSEEWKNKGRLDLSEIFKNRKEGDCGPIYGFNLRHFGAKYINCDEDYTEKGFDQLSWVINEIKTNPFSRRIIFTNYDPSSVNLSNLPPCHVLCQFFVSNDKKLSCSMYQRSCDMGLGVPFNIASYSLLTYMIASICDLKLGEFIYNLGDCHIYNNHINSIKEQILRKPFIFPKLILNKEIKDINNWTLNDIKLKNYNYHPSIKMEMIC